MSVGCEAGRAQSRWLAVALMLAVWLMLPAAVRAQPEQTLEPLQAAPGIWYFRGAAGMADAANRGFMSNAGFVVTGDGVVAFDALGTPRLGAALGPVHTTFVPA